MSYPYFGTIGQHVYWQSIHVDDKRKELESLMTAYLGDIPIENELNPKALLQNIKDDLDLLYEKYEKIINKLTKANQDEK